MYFTKLILSEALIVLIKGKMWLVFDIPNLYSTFYEDNQMEKCEVVILGLH